MDCGGHVRNRQASGGPQRTQQLPGNTRRQRPGNDGGRRSAALRLVVQPLVPMRTGQNVPENLNVRLVPSSAVTVTTRLEKTTVIGGSHDGWNVAVAVTLNSAFPFCTGN